MNNNRLCLIFIQLKVYWYSSRSFCHFSNGETTFSSLGKETRSNIGSAVNPIALRTAKTPLWSFGCFECNRVKGKIFSSSRTPNLAAVGNGARTAEFLPLKMYPFTLSFHFYSNNPVTVLVIFMK